MLRLEIHLYTISTECLESLHKFLEKTSRMHLKSKQSYIRCCISIYSLRRASGIVPIKKTPVFINFNRDVKVPFFSTAFMWSAYTAFSFKDLIYHSLTWQYKIKSKTKSLPETRKWHEQLKGHSLFVMTAYPVLGTYLNGKRSLCYESPWFQIR